LKRIRGTGVCPLAIALAKMVSKNVFVMRSFASACDCARPNARSVLGPALLPWAIASAVWVSIEMLCVASNPSAVAIAGCAARILFAIKSSAAVSDSATPRPTRISRDASMPSALAIAVPSSSDSPRVESRA